MNIALWLTRAAKAKPDAPALLRGTQILADYRLFASAAAQAAEEMARRFAIAPGDRVAIFAPNDPEYLIWMQAIWCRGAVAVPINSKLHPREAAWIIANCNARLVVWSGGDVRLLKTACAEANIAASFVALGELNLFLSATDAAAPVPRQNDDLAWLFYTSGTTGRPKGAMLTHGNLAAMTFAYLTDVDAVRSTDAALYAAPLSHGAGLYSMVHVLKGARHVLPESGGFDAAEVLNLAPVLNDVHLFAAPTMVNRLVREAARSACAGEGIRSIIYGGGPMYVADISRALDVMGGRFIQIYGQGESPMTITTLGREVLNDRSNPDWAMRAASVGRPHACIEVRTVNELGSTVRCGEVGEVIVRGPTVMAGYWENPKASDEALRDNWLWTGDLGSFDEDGFLTLIDRSKDVIISGGSNIYPREVEEVLLSCPGVLETCVVGAADPEWGEAVVAFVVSDGNVSADQLDRHCQTHIARFKRPKRYLFVDALPKNSYGKVLKTELRERLTGDGVPA